jgi:hypothetical protein
MRSRVRAALCPICVSCSRSVLTLGMDTSSARSPTSCAWFFVSHSRIGSIVQVPQTPASVGLERALGRIDSRAGFYFYSTPWRKASRWRRASSGAPVLEPLWSSLTIARGVGTRGQSMADLRLREVAKTYPGGVRAVAGVSLHVSESSCPPVLQAAASDPPSTTPGWKTQRPARSRGADATSPRRRRPAATSRWCSRSTPVSVRSVYDNLVSDAPADVQTLPQYTGA